MLQDANQVIEAQLAPGETVVWTGRPRTGLAFRPHDLPITIFSCIWLAMVIYITGTARFIGRGMTPGGFGIFGDPFAGRPGFMSPLDVFGIARFLFIAVGLYLLLGRFFVDARIRANTYYGLTNRRVLIVTGFWGNRFVSIPLERIGELNVTRRTDGSGTILFGRPTFLEGWHGSSFDTHGHRSYRRIEPPSFDLIDDVIAVRNLIAKTQIERNDEATRVVG